MSMKKALREILNELEKSPDDPKLLARAGELFLKLGENGQAALMFSRLAATYSRDGFFLKAVALWKQSLKLTPSVIELREHLGMEHVRLGLMDEARAYLQDALAAYQLSGDSEGATRVAELLARAAPQTGKS